MNPSKYKRCMVMAGGGFRFGIYLGMHAAACEANQAPDLLLASCGGAIAAGIIQRLPDEAAQREFLASPAMYQLWQSIGPGPSASIHRTLLGAAGRASRRTPAGSIPDVFNDYLFELPLPLPWVPPRTPELEPTQRPDIALLGAKLLFARDDVGKPRQQRKLWEETIFGPLRVAALAQDFTAPLAGPAYPHSAVANLVASNTAAALDDAVRISVSDMYYFACHALGNAHYLGGVVDLFPLELAHRLAHSVMMEFKAPFDQMTSVPAWRAVLGVNANQRIRQVHHQAADVWIDSSDITQTLARQDLQTTLVWHRNRVRLRAPASHEEFAAFMQDHWQYGYARGKEAFARSVALQQGGGKGLGGGAIAVPTAAMRIVNQHNW